ncbi:hypothetical protein GCM10023094_09430 [Rhodococcus olei]|uniref:Uncharacterized protein n=1 Tax=Rhodococcus olei TaxID=2161675 RepID=A0ABP8NY42_9NOCA
MAANDTASDATAYAHRGAEVLVTVTMFPPWGPDDLEEAAHPLRAHAVGAYRNFESPPPLSRSTGRSPVRRVNASANSPRATTRRGCCAGSVLCEVPTRGASAVPPCRFARSLRLGESDRVGAGGKTQ